MTNRIHGHHAPAPRLTHLGAALIAAGLALPGGTLIAIAAALMT